MARRWWVLYVFEACCFGAGEREFVTVHGNGADEPEAVGTGVAGAADAGRNSGGYRPSSWRCTRSSSLAYDGKNYDAAVLAAGRGFGLGANAAAIANMQVPTVLALAYGVHRWCRWSARSLSISSMR